ncbi:hypothetical protein EJ06DRAFT_251842 [Trichodelitschia bisporula]|uniref:Uncharacterized protein n=1 Tax=Trichodelitschia bisporula TaxID=703511 RepID=A0A6G1HJM7_9PEZI|nr:hypothetical protein EJ06DRAFT_251842 [Trichodelitschia bisporula]
MAGRPALLGIATKDVTQHTQILTALAGLGSKLHQGGEPPYCFSDHGIEKMPFADTWERWLYGYNNGNRSALHCSNGERTVYSTFSDKIIRRSSQMMRANRRPTDQPVYRLRDINAPSGCPTTTALPLVIVTRSVAHRAPGAAGGVPDAPLPIGRSGSPRRLSFARLPRATRTPRVLTLLTAAASVRNLRKHWRVYRRRGAQSGRVMSIRNTETSPGTQKGVLVLRDGGEGGSPSYDEVSKWSVWGVLRRRASLEM